MAYYFNLLYYSTDAVFPQSVTLGRENSDMTEYGNQLSDGYSQTKWVAEQIVLKSAQRGLPVAVYRCGNISGDSKTAAWNKQDFVLGIIQGRQNDMHSLPVSTHL